MGRGRSKGNYVGFPVQLRHHVCLGEGHRKQLGRSEDTKMASVNFSPGILPQGTDGLSLEDWVPQSSCPWVLVLTAGVTGPLCTS